MKIQNAVRLAFAGPPHPLHGFPMWFEDSNGLRLELVLNDDPMAPAIEELPKPGEALSFPDNYPGEAFYFMAEARLPVGGNGVIGRARVIMALEAAFGGSGEPAAATRVVFARLRVRMDDLIPDAKYTVSHPYGVTDPLTADDKGRVFYTEDLGIVEGDCSAVLRSGQIAPFLGWDDSAPTVPEGYVGDGVGDHKVKGGRVIDYTDDAGKPRKTGNFVMIEGPRISEGGARRDPTDAGNPDKVWTDLFSVQGRIAKQIGAQATSTTYSRIGGDMMVDVHACSAPGQMLELAGDGVRISLRANDRDYVGRVKVPAMPTKLELINAKDKPLTRSIVTPVDQVIVESVVHDLDTNKLTILARSSDPTAILREASFNQLVSNGTSTILSGIAVTPVEVVVTSSMKGSGHQKVEVRGNAFPNQGVKASAVASERTVVGSLVTLDGTGSRMGTSFSWIQTVGPNVVLAGKNTAIATFTPVVAESLQFRLTVQGPSGPDSVTVDVLVKPKPPIDVVTIDQMEYRTGRRQFRASGTVNNIPNKIVVTFKNKEIGGSQVDATGAWSVRYVVKESETNLVPGSNDQIEVKSSTATISQAISIRN